MLVIPINEQNTNNDLFSQIFNDSDSWPEYFTKARCRKAFSVLEKFRKKLYDKDENEIEFDDFKSEVQSSWNVSYQMMKQILQEMVRVPRYRFVAIKLMDQPQDMVAVEFQELLAVTYGTSFYYSPKLSGNRQKFWDFFRDFIVPTTKENESFSKDEIHKKFNMEKIITKYSNELEDRKYFFAPALREEVFLYHSIFFNRLNLKTVDYLMKDFLKFADTSSATYKLASFYLSQMEG